MATLVLQVAGAALGGLFGPVGAVVGRAAGALAGYALDRSLFAERRTVEGSRLADLGVQSSREGAAIPRLYAAGGGGGAVSSVFGRTGVVAAASGDYDASQVDNDSTVSGATVEDALETLSTAIGGKQDSDADLTALAGVSATGLLARTGSGTAAARSIGAGAGLTGTNLDGVSGDPTLNVGAGTGILSNADDVAIDKASDANVRAAASNKVLTADLIESASAEVSLGSNTIAIDWDAGINFERTLTANGTIGNPTNGQPGTYRTLRLLGDGGTDRSITSFGNQFSAQGLPALSDIDSTQQYLLTIRCITASWFKVVNVERCDSP